MIGREGDWRFRYIFLLLLIGHGGILRAGCAARLLSIATLLSWPSRHSPAPPAPPVPPVIASLRPCSRQPRQPITAPRLGHDVTCSRPSRNGNQPFFSLSPSHALCPVSPSCLLSPGRFLCLRVYSLLASLLLCFTSPRSTLETGELPSPSVMLSLPSFPYPPSKDGYWSPVTSTLNWCEEVR